MQDSIYTQIIKGDVPAYKLYEDERTIAFLDIKPAQVGHTLVVPKVQVEQYLDLTDEDYQAVWHTVHIVGRRLREVLMKERVGVLVFGVDVPHAHVHLVPFNKGESIVRDASSPNPSLRELDELANKLRIQ
jgi:diadenosine tetraphosphate (Ap4A) HIT family hydrolase